MLLGMFYYRNKNRIIIMVKEKRKTGMLLLLLGIKLNCLFIQIKREVGTVVLFCKNIVVSMKQTEF